MNLNDLYKILSKVLRGKVYYGSNVYDNEDNATMPFIVYKEVSNRPVLFYDDKIGTRKKTIQITLVTKSKDLDMEGKLESELNANNLFFSLLSEYPNEDKSLNRVYEIIMEERNVK